MYLLDTNTLTHLQTGNPLVLARLQALPNPDFATTIINKVELLRGRFDFLLKAATRAEFLRAQSLLLRTEQLLDRFPVVVLDDLAISHFERLNTIKGVSKIGRADLLIASIALAQDATLITRNIRHFGLIPNLTVVNWVD